MSFTIVKIHPRPPMSTSLVVFYRIYVFALEMFYRGTKESFMIYWGGVGIN